MSTLTAEQLQVHVDAIRDAFKMTAVEIMRRMVKGELLSRVGAMTGTVYYVLEWNEAPLKALRVVEDLLRVGKRLENALRIIAPRDLGIYYGCDIPNTIAFHFTDGKAL